MTDAEKLQAYETALRTIEQFGHSHGHGRGYTCANIAEEVLKRYSCEETNRLTLKNDKIYTIE